MDLTRDVLYRDFLVNDEDVKANVTSGGTGTGISGCVLENVDISDVDVIQFMEKRSMQDGMDAGEIFKGARRIRLSGTLYAVTRPLLFDGRRELRKAFDPVLALAAEPADKGFQPIYWYEPTNREDFPGNEMAFRLLAVPRSYQDVISRDQQGGDDMDALALPWHATLICKDPTIYGALPQEYYLATGTQTIIMENRGNYPTPLNLLFEIPANQSGSILFTILGTSNLITIPTSTLSRVVRYKGADKILTVEENGGQEQPRLQWMQFNTDKNHAQVSGSAPSLTLTVSGITLGDESRAWFWEAYA